MKAAKLLKEGNSIGYKIEKGSNKLFAELNVKNPNYPVQGK